MNYITKHPVFFTEEIRKHIGIDDSHRAIMNTELARIEKNGIIKRLSRGVYAVPQQTCFGTVLPSESVIAEKIYIENNNGYIAGPSFLNRIGLSTLIPQKTYIKSNRYKYKSNLKFYEILAAKTHINDTNIKYLQLLDGIEDMKKYAVDYDKPYKLLYQYIINNGLDTTKLLVLAHKYYKKDV